jgi:ribonuclease Z
MKRSSIAIGARIAVTTLIMLSFVGKAYAQVPDVQEPSSEADIGEVLTGGVPMGRWKEGLLFEGVRPMPWLKSAANWFPGTEEVQPDEMRVTFMGTAPNIRPIGGDAISWPTMYAHSGSSKGQWTLGPQSRTGSTGADIFI